MSYTVIVGGQKGGIGKTTTAIGLACEWQARGRTVLLVDTDPQQTIGTWAALAEDSGHAAPAVRSIFAANLARELPRLAGAFDIVIVDTPPRQADVQEAALAVADFALLPSQPGAHDLWALYKGMQAVQRELERRPTLRAALLLNRVNDRTFAARNAVQQLEAQGVPLLQSRLREHVDHGYASAAGQGVTVYAPRSEAARELRALCDELEETVGAPLKPARARAVRKAVQA